MLASRLLGVWAAVAAFACCLTAGLWILLAAGFDVKDPLGTGIGLYFIGKAFFVGPMLYQTAKKSQT